MEAWLRGNLNPLLDGQIAQPVEHSPEKAGVVGSIPTAGSIFSPPIGERHLPVAPCRIGLIVGPPYGPQLGSGVTSRRDE